MGVTLMPCKKSLVVGPYKKTHTYENLLSTGVGVVNLSHDGSLFVYTALGDPVLPTFPARKVPGRVLKDCAWWEIKVREMEDQGDRALFTCRIVAEGSSNTISGFNRAQAALLEGAILASRYWYHEPAYLKQELERLSIIVDKTGGSLEKETWGYLVQYLEQTGREADGADA
jgi:hypothetical protein